MNFEVVQEYGFYAGILHYLKSLFGGLDYNSNKQSYLLHHFVNQHPYEEVFKICDGGGWGNLFLLSYVGAI